MAEDSLDLMGEGPQPAGAETPAAYRVLARKYRPASFEALIGQEAMVRTLANAFDLARIHQAYMLTGVRGVGKTTTARILARAFNYHLPARDGQAEIDRPVIHMPELGTHCQAIIESRHVDVIEMDAASHTGIDDVREIIESARYRPIMARTKVYIIDEVHMLSKQAFNGLLKTLEEPPDHVKFLFATTEIDKVPITVRSRCQRFDLRRLESATLMRHLASICAQEGVAIDEEALAILARAAEGSVRDALSLLDQAIAHGAGRGTRVVSADGLREMLGFADRAAIIDLFEALMRGAVAEALGGLKALYDGGADPGQVLVELAEFVHFVTRLKLVPDTARDAAVTEAERVRGGALAEALGMAVLTRSWQLLLKGLQEVKDSPRPLAAAEMILVRLAYAAELPTPDEALRRLASGAEAARAVPPRPAATSRAPAPVAHRGGVAAGAAPASAPAPAEVLRPRLARFEDLVALAAERRDIQLKTTLERDIRLVRFEEGRLEFSLAPGAAPQIVQMLMRKLPELTGARWVVALASEPGAPSLKEQADAAAQAALTGVRADPLVQKALALFPGAEITAVRGLEAEGPLPQPAASTAAEEIAYVDQSFTEDDL